MFTIGSIVSAVLIFGIVCTYGYGSTIYVVAEVEADDSSITNLSVPEARMGTLSFTRNLLQNRHIMGSEVGPCEGEKDCIELGCEGDHCECFELHRDGQPLSYECAVSK